MAVKVIMPKQGLQMTEGTILAWKVKEGQAVEQEQLIAEIETDKATVDIYAPASGTLLRIIHGAGETVGVSETIAIIGEVGESVEAVELREPEQVKPPIENAAAMPIANEREIRPSATGRIFASPRARMRAEEKGIPLEQVRASGPDGLIIERDVLRGSLGYEHRPSGAETQLNGQPGRLVALTAMRAAIARRLRESLSIAAQANHRMDADFSEAARLRKQLQEGGLELSFTDIIMKATAHALRAMPLMNSTWTDRGLFIYQDVNIGIAVALEDGLVVPVVKGADELTLRMVHERSAQLADKARTGKLDPSDHEGGTFTITNLGMYDVESFTAIINQPESGILAVGKIIERPVVISGQIAIRPLATLSLTYDHRVIDGAPAAQFLRLVKSNIENPLLFSV